MNQHKANTALSTSDLLQIDVMRFLAIIAFCLIAISTLLVPQITERADTGAEISAAQIPLKPAAKAPPAAKIAPKVAPKNAAKIVPTTSPKTSPKIDPPGITSATQTASEERTIRRNDPITSTVAPIPAPDTAPQPETSAATPAPSAQSGLSLKFVNDAAFLTLLSQQRISLWAQDPEEKAIWSIDERFNFQEVAQRSPKAFHQLFPDTLPGIIHRAFFDDVNQWTWGITLPEAMQRRLQTMAKQHTEGTLLIDRRGNIHYRSDMNAGSSEASEASNVSGDSQAKNQ